MTNDFMMGSLVLGKREKIVKIRPGVKLHSKDTSSRTNVPLVRGSLGFLKVLEKELR
jgi:hypothetical protein